MKLRNKKTGEIYKVGDNLFIESIYSGEAIEVRMHQINVSRSEYYDSLEKLYREWEDVKEPLINDEKIRKIVREWAEYNQTESVKVYNLVYDHGGVCIENALVRFYDPRLRTDIDVWFKTEPPTFEHEIEYTIPELCGEEEE